MIDKTSSVLGDGVPKSWTRGVTLVLYSLVRHGQKAGNHKEPSVSRKVSTINMHTGNTVSHPFLTGSCSAAEGTKQQVLEKQKQNFKTGNLTEAQTK